MGCAYSDAGPVTSRSVMLPSAPTLRPWITPRGRAGQILPLAKQTEADFFPDDVASR